MRVSSTLFNRTAALHFGSDYPHYARSKYFSRIDSQLTSPRIHMPSPVIKFGQFAVTSQVFYQTRLSFGLVNLKPLVTGHVLVCPMRNVPRVSMLSNEEAQDFYMAVQQVSKAVESYYKADALNISIQDGPVAGQSVPHVHCHIIPRRINDLSNPDEIYALLDGKEGDLEYVFNTIKHNRGHQALGADADSRGARSLEDMEAEAQELANFMRNFKG